MAMIMLSIILQTQGGGGGRDGNSRWKIKKKVLANKRDSDATQGFEEKPENPEQLPSGKHKAGRG